MEPQLIGKSLTIKGKVQGVFYRASTVEVAQNNQLKGWVRNMPNGDVQLVVYGLPSQIDELITWCQRGPQFARVDIVEQIDIPYQEENEFSVKY